jgi:hypothetical protein
LSKTLLTFDRAALGPVVTNKFTDLNVWSLDEPWARQAAAWPQDHFQTHFPFVRRVQLMAATGGNESRDLFLRTHDRETLDDYQFDRLIAACRNIVAHGLKPMIKTGQVPLKLSRRPRFGTFGTNVRPPDDYQAYGRYILDLATALRRHFGLEELRTWSWGVGVEFENSGWFEAEDGRADSTQQAYIRLYDATVAALEGALGADHVTVGAHAMAITPGAWNPLEFLQYCARGRKHLDFLGMSYYTPVPGFDPGLFNGLLQGVVRGARQLGLQDLRFGIDEGRVLAGWDYRVLYPREVQHPIQAASDARLFHLMVAGGVDYCSTWCLTTGGLAGGVPLVSSHFRNLAWRMSGGVSLACQRAPGSGDGVDGLAAWDASSQTLRVMVYHFCPDPDAAACVDVSVRVVGQVHTASRAMRVWTLDRDHGNWWKAWQADAAARRLGADAFRDSVWTPGLPHELVRRQDALFWQGRLDHYRRVGQLKSVQQRARPTADGALAWSTRLQPHAVVLYEIPCS